MTSIVLNGKPHDLPAEATVEHAVWAAGIESASRGVAVAVDGEVVPRGQWGATALGEGQRVEVLRAVQGG